MIKVSNVSQGVAPASVTQKPAAGQSNDGASFANAYAEASGGRGAESMAAGARSSGMAGAAAISSTALKQELSRLQEQLQEAQRRLSMELARPKSDDAISKKQVKLLRSRVAGLQSAIQNSTASLAQLVEQQGGSAPGKLLNVSA